MASSYQILVGGSAVDASVYSALTSLEVEEHAELPGAIELTIPIASDGNGDLTFVNDATFQPFANLAIVVTADGQAPECIFDGYVLSHKLHLDRGVTSSTLKVWGQDASWLMNLEEKTTEWADLTDGDVANAIFGNYGITPAPDNTDDDSPAHTESGHTLMQRATDIQFLRQLARRSGKLCRVTCGAQAGQRTGYFAKPNLEGTPAATLTLNDPSQQMLSALDIEWDVTRPTEVVGAQAVFDDSSDSGVTADVTDSGLTALSDQTEAAFTGKSNKVRLTTTVDDAGELAMRATSLLREGGFFVRAKGEVDLAALGVVLRVGDLVTVNGVGSVHSGTYYVWSVHHDIKLDAYRMSFELVRNAVGSAPSSTGDLLGGLSPP